MRAIGAPTVERTLQELRAKADSICWPACEWTSLGGSGPERLTLKPGGAQGHSFEGLELRPGEPLTLAWSIDEPPNVDGLELAGDRLELRLDTLYPCELRHDGRQLLAEELPTVALGPALVTVVDELDPAENGRLELTVRPPANQLSPWVKLTPTTPRLRARFDEFDLAWAKLALAQALAQGSDDQRTLAAAVAALGEGFAALDLLDAALEPFTERIQGLRVHAVGHSHIDMNWLWTWPDTQAVILRDFAAILELMDDYPEFTFSHSQPASYEVVRDQAPALFGHVLERIREGRWEAATLQWVEGDTNMASHEATARQTLEAVLYSRELLETSPCVFHAPDTFGHAGNLPQIAASAGARAYYHHRANPNGHDIWPAYWWEGQDGTRLLGLTTPSYNGHITASGLARAAIRALRHGQRSALQLYGVGDHGGGPTRISLDCMRALQATEVFPEVLPSTIGAFGEEILRRWGSALPSSRGESRTVFEGCYTTHVDVKQGNRDSENALTTAEALCALAGVDRRDELTRAWRKTLFHQFHDILDGSAINEAYGHSHTEYAEVLQSAHAATEAALDRLSGGLAAGTIAVTNPLGFERSDVVLVPELAGEGSCLLRALDGKRVVGQRSADGLRFVADVPAFATTAYELVEERPQLEPLAAKPSYGPGEISTWHGERSGAAPYLEVETERFRALVRRDCGIIVSLLDRRTDRELVAYGTRRTADYLDSARSDLALNVLQLVEEHPHGMSAWHYDEVFRETSFLRGGETTLVEEGPVRIVLETRHAVRSSTVALRTIFYRELERIDFEAAIDWQELGSSEAGVPNLKVAFTMRLQECEAWFETPFGAARRPADGQETPALRFADVGGSDYGFALLNAGRYGYDALGTRLRLNLVRSAYEPDPISDIGTHCIRYALLPHAGPWQDAGVVQAAAGLNQPLLGRVVKRETASATPAPFRPTLTAGTVAVSSLKPAQRGDGVVIRLYEYGGRPSEVTLEGVPVGARVSETTVVEDPIGTLEAMSGRLPLTFRPWQVRTLLVESGTVPR